MLADKELLYFADPMCSWCWGFAPTAQRLAERFAVEAPFALIVGGLLPGTEAPLEPDTRAMIRSHWERVHEATGQPFDYAFFDRGPFVYDTEPGCRAVVAARRIDGTQALPMLERLHRAFYSENRDITDAGVLAELGAELLGIGPPAFREELEREDTERETYADFQLARELGVNGFPTLLACRADSCSVFAQGFKSYDEIEPALTEWLRADEPAPR